MTKINSLIKLIACGGMIVCTNVLAQSNDISLNNTSTISIPILENAKVFADFSDKLPAVIDYFTKADEDSVINFYQMAYGEVLSQERKRGRLTLTFADDTNNIRVVISTQNKMRQVDVLVEKK
ncbi:MAG: hypothetical protein JKX78_11635 [Alteromonadaceae bacterium]|nr:hypothetical protein [Alteromonadaceae bacterium]